MEESRLPAADAASYRPAMQQIPESDGCYAFAQTSGEASASDLDLTAWPCFDDFTDTTPAFGWEYQAPHESPSTQQSPPAECPPDDLDFDTLLQGLEGFEGDGENFGGFDAEQSHGTFEGSFGACEGTLGSLDSILPSDFHFPMGLGDESPRSSDLDCMTSPPGDEECPRSALPRKRKGKAKQTRQPKVKQTQQKTIRRPRGRPRVYDTSIPERGLGSAGESDSGSAEVQSKKRGAKPKYKFSTEAEAVAMRRERNRNTAISSYYRKKQRDEQLLHAIECLERERDALQQLENIVQSPAGVDIGLLGQTLRQTCSGQQTILQLHGGQPAIMADGRLC